MICMQAHHVRVATVHTRLLSVDELTACESTRWGGWMHCKHGRVLVVLECSTIYTWCVAVCARCLAHAWVGREAEGRGRR